MSKYARIAKKHYQDGDWTLDMILMLAAKGKLTPEEVDWILGENAGET